MIACISSWAWPVARPTLGSAQLRAVQLPRRYCYIMASDYSVVATCIARVADAGTRDKPPVLKLLFSVPDHVGDAGLDPPGDAWSVHVPTAQFHKDDLVMCDEAGNWRLLAEGGSPRGALFSLLRDTKLNPLYPVPVRHETVKWLQNPCIDDSSLEDLTDLPFCTIDNDDSRDLDQAMYICSDPASSEKTYTVYYALADAAFYVAPGSALFEHALLRGTSFYLPTLSVPMLPPALSEGVVSLNPDVDRRALVFIMHLDAQGNCTSTSIKRARICSKAKLSYRRVQNYYDLTEPDAQQLSNQPYSETLDLLRTVGTLRIALAESRDLVRYDRTELAIHPTPAGFHLTTQKRYESERYNEQISVLCNSQGANLLREAGMNGMDHVQGLYRVHDEPSETRLIMVQKFIEELRRTRGLDEKWAWDVRGETAASYLARLPDSTEDEKRINHAIERRFLVINERGRYDSSPGEHFGLGVDPYARVSAPMREIIGIMTHKETLEMVGLAPYPGAPDPRGAEAIERDVEIRERVIKSADAARQFQGVLSRAVDLLAISSFFGKQLASEFEARERFEATVMGISATRIYVELKEPPLEVKIYLDDLGRACGRKWIAKGASKEPILVAMSEEPWNSGKEGNEKWNVGKTEEMPEIGRYAFCMKKMPIVVGDRLAVVVVGFDEGRKRWSILPVD